MDCIKMDNFKRQCKRHTEAFHACACTLTHYLTECVLTDQYIVDNVEALLSCLCECSTDQGSSSMFPPHSLAAFMCSPVHCIVWIRGHDCKAHAVSHLGAVHC